MCLTRAVPLTVLLLVLLLPAAPHGHADAPGIFDAEDELAVVLEFPLRRLLRDREAREEYDARLHYRDGAGELVTVPLEIRARGHKRLELCAFPPLRLDFKGKSSAGTLFAGIDELKLVTQCGRRQRYHEYLVLEYAIYRAWERLSPYAFRTRALRVSYRDTESKDDPYTQFAFLVEDLENFAERLDTRRIRRETILPGAYLPEHMALLALFQYLIGNTDWSPYGGANPKGRCCHNGKVVAALEDREHFAFVPYDFDHAGVVDADYAEHHPMFRVPSVRYRYYRGLCRYNAQLPAAIDRLNRERSGIETPFRDERLSARSSRLALGYIADFYAIVNDPGSLQRRIYDKCRELP